MANPTTPCAPIPIAFRAVVTPVYTALLDNPAFTAHLAPLRDRILLEIPDMLRDLKQDVGEVKTDTTHIIGQNDANMAALAQLNKAQTRRQSPSPIYKASPPVWPAR